MLRTIRRAEYAELIALFFLQGAALSIWFVPSSTVLDANGLREIRPFAFAASAIAAFVSPLVFGAMADRHASPVSVLRGLAFASAAAIALASWAIQFHWNAWLVLAILQLYSLCSAPAFSLSSAIIFARLANAQMEFGPLRAMATLGWMAGAVLVSALDADRSAGAGYTAAITWLALGVFTSFLSKSQPPRLAAQAGWRERFGLDALTLLKNPDHRVVFIIAALSNIPIAGFYPYAPPHLEQLGFKHSTAWMALAQTTEVIFMFGLGALLVRWRLKWIFAVGLVFGVTRFALSALNTNAGLLAGVALHGASFVPVFITAQIYVDQRIAPEWRARAQSLLTLMNNGVGNLFGYLGTGWWFSACSRGGATNWTNFWGGLAAAMALVLIYFLVAYHGQGRTGQHQAPQ